LPELVQKFHGHELLAMAGYNGGPHRVSEWLDMRGDQPLDEFVEEIPYDQAREYTKKVTRFLHMYMRAYEGRSDLYIGQQLQRDYRIMPNF
jgi:soluble lytic murein transglycosylase